jgi:hypothetical protein
MNAYKVASNTRVWLLAISGANPARQRIVLLVQNLGRMMSAERGASPTATSIPKLASELFMVQPMRVEKEPMTCTVVLVSIRQD